MRTTHAFRPRSLQTSADRARVIVAAVLMMFATTAPAFAQSEYLPRNNYGRKFEPVDGILHGAGQTYYQDGFSRSCGFGSCLSEGAERYVDVLGTDRAPLLFMDYNNSTSENNPAWYAGLKSRIEAFETQYNRQLVPQLGTWSPSNEILNSTQIDNIVNGLASLERPVFYRATYEANGPWFGHSPSSYITNFRNLSNAIRAADLPVAMVWNVVVGDGGNYSQWEGFGTTVEDFYPGDEYVDWWSFNVFGNVTFGDFWDNEVGQFLDAADEAGFPVLIGEATPQFTGGEDASDWADWYEPFFDRIKNSPGIKAHTYINWDWGQTNPVDNWTNWGDASLENAHPTVRQNYIDELSDPIYVHSDAVLPALFSDNFDPADFNQDGTVDQGDLDDWTTAYQGTDAADANGDGVSNGADYLIWQQNAAALAPSASSAVPEPSGLGLVFAALTGPLAARRRSGPLAARRRSGLLVARRR